MGPGRFLFHGVAPGTRTPSVLRAPALSKRTRHRLVSHSPKGRNKGLRHYPNFKSARKIAVPARPGRAGSWVE